METEKKKILVVDDMPINAKLIKILLSKFPYEVDAVYSGREALRLAKENPPYAVLLDIMMPDIDGFKVLETLKAEPETAGIKVIMQSAFSGSETKSKAAEMGASGYVCKPISVEKLIALLEPTV